MPMARKTYKCNLRTYHIVRNQARSGALGDCAHSFAATQVRTSTVPCNTRKAHARADWQNSCAERVNAERRYAPSLPAPRKLRTTLAEGARVFYSTHAAASARHAKVHSHASSLTRGRSPPIGSCAAQRSQNKRVAALTPPRTPKTWTHWQTLRRLASTPPIRAWPRRGHAQQRAPLQGHKVHTPARTNIAMINAATAIDP